MVWVMVGVMEWIVEWVKNEKVEWVINRVEWVKNGKFFKIGGGNGVGNQIPTRVNSRISYLN